MQGYDPYDLLASRLPLQRFGATVCFFLSQLHKRSPVNLRPVLRIPPTRMAKTLGLLLTAYARLARCEADGTIGAHLGNEAEARLRPIFRRLLDTATATPNGISWGLPFAYASSVEMIAAHTPSLVVTAFVHRGIAEYYRQTGDPEALRAMQSCCRFVLDDLPRYDTGAGWCFAYTATNPMRCYNATILAAEMLARTWALTRGAGLLEPARRTVGFVLSRQHGDGHWAYALLPDGTERTQTDFHQGFVVDALRSYKIHSGDADTRIDDAIARGAEYYRRIQFAEDGRALWRVPRHFPTDIHHQAQGIFTFAQLADISSDYPHFASRIARWTIDNMQSREGYFIYRRGRWLTNRLDYMRWGQAWMMLALVTLLDETAATDVF